MKQKNFQFDCETDDGVKIFAQGWSPSEQPAAIFCLIHGLGEHSGRYAHFAEHLNNHNIALLAFDLRGHGRSDGARGHASNFKQLVDDVDCFLDHAESLFPDSPHFLYGHSLGGTLVLHHAMQGGKNRNLRGVIATAPMFRPAFQPPKWKVTLARLVQAVVPKLSLSNEVQLEHLSRNPQVMIDCMNDTLVHNRISAKLGVCFLDAGLEALEVTSEFPFDLLLMHGVEDQITCHHSSVEFAEKAGEFCTLKLWSDLYHELHNEPEKEEIFDFVVAWAQERI